MKASKRFAWDIIAVRVVDGDKSLNLTWSRYRDTVSARGLDNDMVRAFARAWTAYRNQSHELKIKYGDRLDTVKAAAEGLENFDQLLGWMEREIESPTPV